MRTTIYTALMVLGFTLSAFTQQYEWVRAHQLDYSMNPAMIQTSTTTDDDNCVYMWSMRNFKYIYGTKAFGDLALTKYDASGNEIYAKTIYGHGSIITMKDDGQKYVYLLGIMRSNLGFWGSSIMGHGGGDDSEYFLARISPQGEPELMLNIDGLFQTPVYNISTFSFNNQGNLLLGWASPWASYITEISVEGDSLSSMVQENVPLISGIATNSSGEIFTTGSCAGPLATFAGVAHEPEFGYNRYIAKYNADGDVQWVRYVEDITCNFPTIQCDDNGNVYYADLLHIETQFGSHTANGPEWVYDYFLTRLNADGEYQWVKEVPVQSQIAGDASLGANHSLTIDNQGNPILCGFQRGTIDWGNGIVSEAETYYDYFMIKYDPEGNVQWVKNGGGKGYDTFHELAISDDGSIYASGIAHDTIYLDNIIHYEEGWLYPVLVRVTDQLTGVTVNDIPADHLLSVYPNPATGTMCLRYLIYGSGYLISDLFGVSGNLIKRIVEKEVSAGMYEFTVDISGLPAGVYFIRSHSNNQIQTQKLIIE